MSAGFRNVRRHVRMGVYSIGIAGVGPLSRVGRIFLASEMSVAMCGWAFPALALQVSALCLVWAEVCRTVT